MIDQTRGSTKPPKIAVIGAGLTGLLAAQGLKKVVPSYNIPLTYLRFT
jgi:monoamine oxidase